VFAALGIQLEIRMRRIVTCDLSGFTNVLHIVTKANISKKEITEHEISVLIFSTTFL
jgi:hypothetical protein